MYHCPTYFVIQRVFSNTPIYMISMLCTFIGKVGICKTVPRTPPAETYETHLVCFIDFVSVLFQMT